MIWANLKPLRDDLRPVRVNGEELVKTDVDARIQAGLPADLALTRKAGRRAFINGTHLARCADLIKRMPEPGETVHAVVGSTFPLWAIVPTVARLAGCRIDALHASTLSFSKANADELLGMLDAGEIGSALLLASAHFRVVNADIFDPCYHGLTTRGQRIATARTHAKVLCLALADGRRVTVEGSANLRSGKSVEQFAMAADAALYDFHVGWIEDLYRRGTTNRRPSP